LSGEDAPRSEPRAGALTSSLTTSCGVVRFKRSGQGRPVVFLHDLARSLESFDPLAPRLGPGYQVIQIDLLGHGGSDKRPADLSIGAHSAAVAEVLDDLGLERSVIVGHSLGGSVALSVARADARLVSRLVLISSGVYEYVFPFSWKAARTALGWRLLGILGGPGTVERAWRLARVTPPEVEGAGDPLETREGWAALGRAFRQTTSDSSLAELERLVEEPLSHPTLVLWGTENRVLPLPTARVFFQGRRHARFVEVAGTAHAVHEEAPQVVADVIREFLE